jgi:hypothetical protein
MTRTTRRKFRPNCDSLESRQLLSTYNLNNASSGKVLDDRTFSSSNGALIQQYQLNGSINQQQKVQQQKVTPPFTNPAASKAYSPAPAGTPLFKSGGPSYLDVQQGQVADCWLLASLAEVAARNPQDITNMFTYDGTTVENGATVGLYAVRFFKGDGSASQVVVDTELPSGGGYYDQVHNALGTQVLWVALAEKAYAVANGLGYVTTSHGYQNSYNALNGGDPAWALQAITGKSASDFAINPSNIAAAWSSGNLVVLGTNTPTSSFIVSAHCYAVVGYNSASSQPFEVFNPWGTTSASASATAPGWAPWQTNRIYGLFWASAAFISQNFTAQSLGTGAINENNGPEPVNELAESATLSGGYATSGTINITRYRPGGSVVGAATATGRLSNKMAIGYTRPAQATAIGTGQWEASNHHPVGLGTTQRPVLSLR